MSSKYDYDSLEREFIEGPLDQSVRQFSANHGIAAWSTVNAQAKRRKWVQRRLEFHQKLQARTVEKIVDRTAEKAAQIREDFLGVTQAAIFKMAQDIRDEKVVITPEGLTKLIDRVLLLTGQPTQIGEQRNLGINLSNTGLPPDILREIAELTQGGGPEPGTARRAALPGGQGPRTN